LRYSLSKRRHLFYILSASGDVKDVFR